MKGPEQKTQVIGLEELHAASGNVLQLPEIERENVRKVYDTIAEHWNHTRYRSWPGVQAFVDSLPAGSLVADLGCGNGKMIPAIEGVKGFAVASDASEPLVRIAAETFGASTFVADCLNTPLRGGIYDAALSIAVLHHLSTRARRVQALAEGARLLKPGGRLLVYCWSLEQGAEVSRSRHRFEAQDVLVPWKYRTPGVRKQKRRGGKGPVEADSAASDSDGAAAEASGQQQQQQQQQPEWKEELEVQQRYCHVYKEGELLELLADVPELEVVESYFDTGNWCAVARRRDELGST